MLFFTLDTWVLAVVLAGVMLGATVAGLVVGRADGGTFGTPS